MSAGAEVVELHPAPVPEDTARALAQLTTPGLPVSLSANWPGQPGLTTVHLSSVGEALAMAVRWSQQGATGVFLRVCQLAVAPAKGRGGADASVIFPGLWGDVDTGAEGHEHDPARHDGLPLPATPAEGQQLLMEAGVLAPTFMVATGGGLHPYWLLDTAVVLEDDNRAEVADLSRRWHAAIARAFAAHGRHYGLGVHDLGRVLRLAGTVNRKPNRTRAATARIVYDGGPRYTLAELWSQLQTLEDRWPAPTTPVASPATTAPARATTTEPVDDVTRYLFSGSAGVPLNLAAQLTELVAPVMVSVLEFYGWTEVGTDTSGAVLLRRPGNPAHPVSAKWWGNTGSPNLTVHSSETELPAGADQKLTPPKVLAYLAGFHGDLSAFSKALQPALQGVPSADTFGIPASVMAELRNRYAQHRPVAQASSASPSPGATVATTTRDAAHDVGTTDGRDDVDDVAVQTRESLLAAATREAYLRQRATIAARDLIRTEDEHAAGVSPEVWGAESGTLTDLADLPGEPPARITGLLPAGGRVTLVAARKSGKTTAMLNLARCLLTGEAFLGQFPVRALGPGERVAFVNLEVSHQQFQRWAGEHDVPGHRVWVANLRGRPNPLATASGRAWLVEQLRAQRCTVLILDTFGRAFTGENQDSNSEVTRFLAGVIDPLLAEAGVGEFLMTVHTGWSGERSRGASALEDWPDALWRMTRPGKDPKDGDDEQDAGQRFFSAEGRDVDVPEDALAYDPTTRTLTLSGAGNRREARENRRAAELLEELVPLIREHPGIHQRALVAEYRASLEGGKGLSSGAVGAALGLGVSTGRLSVSDGPNRRQCYSVIRL